MLTVIGRASKRGEDRGAEGFANPFTPPSPLIRLLLPVASVSGGLSAPPPGTPTPLAGGPRPSVEFLQSEATSLQGQSLIPSPDVPRARGSRREEGRVGLAVAEEPNRRDSHARRPPEDRKSRLFRLGLILVAVGALSVLTAALGLHRRTPTSTPSSLVSPVDQTLFRTTGPVDMELQVLTYGPGQTSGWHLHPGVHLVTVLSGTLTVYDAECQARIYGPGQPYVGGEELHLARNETDAPVEMAVTYVTRAGAPRHSLRVAQPAPPGCPVA
jgi:quercetin dioxygenase-like cupin family protein